MKRARTVLGFRIARQLLNNLELERGAGTVVAAQSIISPRKHIPLSSSGKDIRLSSPVDLSLLSTASRAWSSAPQTQPTASARIQEFRLAQTGEGIKECELVQWFVKEGDSVEPFSRVCEVQSDKATVEITSPFAGIVKKLHHEPGAMVQVGEILADIESEEESSTVEIEEPPPPVTPPFKKEEKATLDGPPLVAKVADILTSPAVRHLAHELALDLAFVSGTGPEGRITKQDVLEASANVLASPASASSIDRVGVDSHRRVEPAAPYSIEIPLRGYRRSMFKSMSAVASIPHFHFCEEVGMDGLVDLRTRLKGVLDCGGANLTYLPFFIKAATLALQEYPGVNASLSPDQSAIIQHGTVNLGIAMATPHGLVVPNIKDAGNKSIAQLAREVGRLQGLAQKNALSPEDVSGGTFTLSNIGSVGGTYATPLINPPEVAIMALGRMKKVPRYDEVTRTFVPASVLSISCGADHRVVDGATLAGFAMVWRKIIENPGSLMLHLK